MKRRVCTGAMACAAVMAMAIGMAPSGAHAQSVDVAKALNGIEKGCGYDYDAVGRIRDAYGAEAAWTGGNAGRWVATVRKPDGGRALSPALGRGTLTIDSAEQVSRFSVRVQGATWHGIPVTGLVWTSGLETGVSIFEVNLGMPPAAAKAQLRAKGVALRPSEDDETGMVFEPTLVGDKRAAGASLLVCDMSM